MRLIVVIFKHREILQKLITNIAEHHAFSHQFNLNVIYLQEIHIENVYSVMKQ